MAMKWFRYPFAVSGDKTTVPDGTQGDGSVSYEQGYGLDYSRNPETDPAAKRVERNLWNQLIYDITNYLRNLSIQGTPDWVDPADNGGTAVSYPLYAQVMYDDGAGVKRYESLIANNTSLPTDATKWRQVISKNGRLIGVRIFGTPGTFTYSPTPGTIFIVAEIQGGGGGGGGANATSAANSSAGTGGGGGAYSKTLLDSNFSGLTVIVGAGGTAGTSGGTAGTSGGTSSFGGATAQGGGGGSTLPATGTYPSIRSAAAGGTALGGTITNIPGQPGGNAILMALGNLVGGNGGNGACGGGGALQATVGGGSGAVAGTAGSPNSGGGGSGAASTASPGGGANGGAGGSGFVKIWEYA